MAVYFFNSDVKINYISQLTMCMNREDNYIKKYGNLYQYNTIFFKTNFFFNF